MFSMLPCLYSGTISKAASYKRSASQGEISTENVELWLPQKQLPENVARALYHN